MVAHMEMAYSFVCCIFECESFEIEALLSDGFVDAQVVKNSQGIRTEHSPAGMEGFWATLVNSTLYAVLAECQSQYETLARG